MGLITSIKESITKLFSAGEPKRIGIYGPPNAGKCLAATEQILLSDGTRRSIEDVYGFARERCPDAPDVSDEPYETWLECPRAGIRVPALSDDFGVTSATVSHVFRQRYCGSMYRIQTESGRGVTTSPDHPFITPSKNGRDFEQTKAGDISTGCSVALFSSVASNTSDRLMIDRLVSDGLVFDYEHRSLHSGTTQLSTDGGVAQVISHDNSVSDTGSRDNSVSDTRNDITWDEVVSVEKIEYDGYIYDLTVPEHHTFATGDGLIVHNTTLANRIARDWTGDAVGPESHVPHETRRARRKENVEIKRNGSTVTIDIVDTPGVTTKVDYKEFLEHDMTKEDAVRRSREATEGVAEAMHWLREDVDGVVYVLDSTEDPFTQVNTMLVGIIESRDLPVLIFANKIDLDESSTQRIVNAFPQHDVVPLSALEGDNMKEVYNKIAMYFG